MNPVGQSASFIRHLCSCCLLHPESVVNSPHTVKGPHAYQVGLETNLHFGFSQTKRFSITLVHYIHLIMCHQLRQTPLHTHINIKASNTGTQLTHTHAHTHRKCDTLWHDEKGLLSLWGGLLHWNATHSFAMALRKSYNGQKSQHLKEDHYHWKTKGRDTN